MNRTSFLLGLALLLPVAVTAHAPSLHAGGGETEPAKKADRPTIDSAQVYYGEPAACKKPAVVDADRVFLAIPEYRKIVDDGLTEKDAKYSVLLLKATHRFKAAIRAAAEASGNDLVANVGAVEWEGHDVPDLTEDALTALREAEAK
ncbi:MAG: hypothetical protein ACYTG4_11835 [Planctomycetota bacterium]|jgi:hypothetical protein